MPCAPATGDGGAGVRTGVPPSFLICLFACASAEAFARAAAAFSAACRFAVCLTLRIPATRNSVVTTPRPRSSRNGICRHHGPAGAACFAAIRSRLSGGNDSGVGGNSSVVIATIL